MAITNYYAPSYLYEKVMPDGNSLVTITIKDLCEAGFQLFDQSRKYPIWAESHRAELEDKIIEHYYMRQIGFETPGRFKFELNKKMREIMPYYIELFKTTQFNYNPIENYNMKEGSTDVSTGSESGTGKSTSRVSDTPQGSIENIDKYMSSAQKEDHENASKTDSKLTHEAHRTGNIGVTTTQQMIEQERKIILNIDMLIIEELNELFLGVY